MNTNMNKTSPSFALRLSAVFAAALLGLTASAADMVKHGDKVFIEKAAKSGHEEVAISQVAVERTTNPQVKALAQMMVDDHTAAGGQLATIAAAKGVKLPAQDLDDAKKWSKKDTKDFDKDYAEKMVADHKDAVELFQKQATKGEDADTKAFARDTLPKLQHHLEMAIDLKKSLK